MTIVVSSSLAVIYALLISPYTSEAAAYSYGGAVVYLGMAVLAGGSVVQQVACASARASRIMALYDLFLGLS